MSRWVDLVVFFPDANANSQVASGALIPLEVCEVPPGQIMRKQVPPEKTKDVLEFATKKPAERLNSIRNGLAVTRTTNPSLASQRI